jgi:hypothetical protein
MVERRYPWAGRLDVTLVAQDHDLEISCFNRSEQREHELQDPCNVT